MNNKATTGEGKAIMGQLNSLINYYNQQAGEQKSEIQFDEWKNKIATKGLVEKIETNFKDLMK